MKDRNHESPEAMKAVSNPPDSHLDGWLNLLILSAREVFHDMLNTKLAPAFEPSKTLGLEWTAMVALSGELRGVLMLSCDEKSAIAITSKMLGVPLEEVNAQTKDAMGEVCNMVAGNFKHKINGLNERSALSPPCVVTGTDYRVHMQESPALQSLQVTFVFDKFPIHISLKVRK